MHAFQRPLEVLIAHSGFRGLEDCGVQAHQVTRPAPAQIKAPTAMVHGTPTPRDRNPDSSPLMGIMPPNTSARFPRPLGVIVPGSVRDDNRVLPDPTPAVSFCNGF